MVMPGRARSYLMLAAVFVLGALAGAGTAYAYAEREWALFVHDETGEQHDQRRLWALGRELDLSSSQRERIRVVMQQDRPERRKLARAMFEQCGSKLIDQRHKMEDEIRAVLTPEQKKRFDDILRRRTALFGR
jgi:Spy/CpxP family protein refolding chaperone